MSMFDQEFDEMIADVWFDSRDAALANEHGIGELEEGWNTFHSNDALVAVRKYDLALKGNHYVRTARRLRAQRNSIVDSFGPDMAERVGYA